MPRRPIRRDARVVVSLKGGDYEGTVVDTDGHRATIRIDLPGREPAHVDKPVGALTHADQKEREQ